MHILNTLQGACRVLQHGFRGQRVCPAPPRDAARAGRLSAPGEDALCLNFSASRGGVLSIMSPAVVLDR